MNPTTDYGRCRFCGARLTQIFADLGMSPLANSYLKPEQLARMEAFFPLRALVCHECLLVQLEDYETPEAIFTDYAYFSSYSKSWLDHARRYVDTMNERFGLSSGSKVVELASNDGYLLQYFREAGVPVLGIEPAANVAEVAIENGIPTRVEFFGRESARHLRDEAAADLLLGNNVLAHVPDLNDFVGGMKILLKPDGVITMEFPHLLRLIENDQFDTIYHEHFSYFSFLAVRRVFAAHGLRLWNVEEFPTHGGSLRIYGCHEEDPRADEPSVQDLLARERAAGLGRMETYAAYSERVKQDKLEILEFLVALKREGKRIAGYGAPAKGNTLLNYCGVGREFLDFTVDLSPHKQGRFLPGSRIPIESPERIAEARPDVVLILPWNLRNEIMDQMHHVTEWGGRFAVRSPKMTLLP